MKDQPTKASVDPFDMSRLEGPAGRFNARASTIPIAVEQREIGVERDRLFRVGLNRVNGENQHKAR